MVENDEYSAGEISTPESGIVVVIGVRGAVMVKGGMSVVVVVVGGTVVGRSESTIGTFFTP